MKVKGILKELDPCGKETLFEAMVIEVMGRALGAVGAEDTRDSSPTAATMHRCSNYERRCQTLPQDGCPPRSTETKPATFETLSHDKVIAVSWVLTHTLHRAIDPLLFWRERIAKLAKGSSHLCGVGA